MRGEITVALVLTIIAALKTFDLVYMTTSGGPGNSTTVPSYEVYFRAFDLREVGSASAVAIVLANMQERMRRGQARMRAVIISAISKALAPQMKAKPPSNREVSRASDATAK